MPDGSTIFALSSAPGRAGIAVIRVSGPTARTVAERMAPPLAKPREAAFRAIRHPATGEILDRAVVIFFEAARSETGEDVVEIQVHGGRAVVCAVLGALGTIPGCRMAEPGEFARRAFQNGKLDLAEVEGLADLVEAETEAQRRQAVSQSGGALSKLYEGWRAELIAILALAEAAIDFSDEGDVGTNAIATARERARPLVIAIRKHLDDGHRGEILREGFRVALLGAPNAGKSSLLNALARREAAIVSEEAGTTRDVIEVRLDLNGLPVIVSDTAGIRDTQGIIEREGIRRSLIAARDAQLVLWLTETGLDSPPHGISRETSLEVRTKIDLESHKNSLFSSVERAGVGGITEGAWRRNCTNPESPPPGLPHKGGGAQLLISAKTGDGVDILIAEIARRASEALGDGSGAPVITQARHRKHLETAAAALDTFLASDLDAFELRAEDIRQAAHALGRITGRVDVEDVLGEIFSRFCIGK